MVPNKKPRGWAENYEKAVIEYLNTWEELFEKAQEKDEFQFILALLRFKGAQSAGWDSFENTIEAFNATMKATRKARGNDKLNLFLWLYGHITEASDHYEIIANMVSIAGGEPYRAWNFPKKRKPTKKNPSAMREQTPYEKILEIQNRCKNLKLRDYSKPFEEVLDKELRNAVFHSDYSVHQGTVRFINGETGLPIEYDTETTNLLINRALALHETIKNLVNTYRGAYNTPRVINTGPHFQRDNISLKAQIIVRKGQGVTALKETPDHPAGFIVGTFYPGEKERIEEEVYLLPKNHDELLNKLLDRLPLKLAQKLLKLYSYVQKR